MAFNKDSPDKYSDPDHQLKAAVKSVLSEQIDTEAVERVKAQAKQLIAEQAPPHVYVTPVAEKYASIPDVDDHAWSLSESAFAVVASVGPPLLSVYSSLSLSDYSFGLGGWVRSASLSVLVSLLIFSVTLTICCRVVRSLRNIAWRCMSWNIGSVVVTAVLSQAVLAYYTSAEITNRQALFSDHKWVTYDSIFFWPENLKDEVNHEAKMPSVAETRKELSFLSQSGFDGVIVQGFNQPDATRIAREVGFKAIVLVISTDDEIDRAISAKEFVDAYVIGNLQLKEVDLRALRQKIAMLRKKSGSLVTSSFLASDYLGERGRELRELEDFAFPALPRSWKGNGSDASVDKSVELVKSTLDSLGPLKIPSLLTHVFYPSDGGPTFTEDAQYEFFKRVLNLERPNGVNIAYFNSFDRPWAGELSKVADHTPEFEGHTGIYAVKFNADGTFAEFRPKKAAILFVSRSSVNE